MSPHCPAGRCVGRQATPVNWGSTQMLVALINGFHGFSTTQRRDRSILETVPPDRQYYGKWRHMPPSDLQSLSPPGMHKFPCMSYSSKSRTRTRRPGRRVLTGSGTGICAYTACPTSATTPTCQNAETWYNGCRTNRRAAGMGSNSTFLPQPNTDSQWGQVKPAHPHGHHHRTRGTP
jgi:hypothetical protein